MSTGRTCAAVAGALLLLAIVAKAQDERLADDLSLINDIKPSEYWLGIMIAPPSPEVREKLKLPDGQGLMVEKVEPKSPADKAGLKPQDVLLKANDKPLGDLRDLLKLMNEVKEGQVTFDVLRAGKHQSIVALPAKRTSSDLAEARKWMEKLGPRMSQGQPLRFHIVRPGQIVAYSGAGSGEPDIAVTKMDVTVQTKATLADGSQVEITRHGSDPAKVAVTREVDMGSKERWEGTSGDLSKIPETIRPDVERLLNSAMGHDNIFSTSEMPGTIVVGPNVEKRLNEMQKQIDDLRKQIEALQGAKQKKD